MGLLNRGTVCGMVCGIVCGLVRQDGSSFAFLVVWFLVSDDVFWCGFCVDNEWAILCFWLWFVGVGAWGGALG